MTYAQLRGETTVEPAPSGMGRGARILLAVFGLAAIAVGVALLFHPAGAARSLALLVAAAIVIGGLLELASASEYGHPWIGWLLGGILVVGGVVAVVWPGITLWALAIIIGLSLILHGILRIVLAVAWRESTYRWGWIAAAGVGNLVLGVLVLAWPEATVLVLSLLFGAQILLFGILVVSAALRGGGRRGGSVRYA